MDAEGVRQRAQVSHYEPPVYGLDEPMWVAEDDETGCAGVGRVEAEAVGNLVAAVDSHGEQEGAYVKLPGRVVERRWDDGRGDDASGGGDGDGGLLDRLPGWG